MDTEELPKQSELDRILGFSDGIFAFAITLLALTFDVPRIQPNLADAQLYQEIFVKQVDNYSSFFISFVVVGSFWISHHQKFKYIHRYNKTFLWINLLALMFIVYLPYPTEILGDYANSRVAVIFYSLSISLTSLMFALIWIYASWNHRLIDKNLSKKYIDRTTLFNLLIPLLFLTSIPISFINLDLARYSWLLIWIIPLILPRIIKSN